MIIEIHWRVVRGERDEAWDWTRVLYAYQHPEEDEILYIGKADGSYSTVRSRWNASDKAKLWSELEAERGITSHIVLVGNLALEEGTRMTRELLADVESLLIKRVKPWGNIQARKHRISRPGMIVRCHGRAWPAADQYHDRG